MDFIISKNVKRDLVSAFERLVDSGVVYFLDEENYFVSIFEDSENFSVSLLGDKPRIFLDLPDGANLCYWDKKYRAYFNLLGKNYFVDCVCGVSHVDSDFSMERIEALEVSHYLSGRFRIK